MVDLLDVTANDIEDTSEVLDIDKMNVFQKMLGMFGVTGGIG